MGCGSEYATSEHLENPVAVHNSTIGTTSLPIECKETTVTDPKYGGPEKIGAEAILIDKCPQSTEFRSWTISFKGEVFHSSQYPQSRFAMDR